MSHRTVYATGAGRICPACGWPAKDCRCSTSAAAAGHEVVPDRPVAKLRLEKAGRGGKTVTVLDGLPNNQTFLTELATALKKACGTGGTVRPGAIELAGDVRERIRPLLAARNFVVKG